MHPINDNEGKTASVWDADVTLFLGYTGIYVSTENSVKCIELFPYFMLRHVLNQVWFSATELSMSLIDLYNLPVFRV